MAEERADGFLIRPAGPSDAGALAALTAAAFSADPGTPGTPGPGDWDEDPDLVRLCVQEPGSGRIVAAATARSTGQWWGGRRVPATALSGVAVDLAFRGRGLGRWLLEETLEAARTTGAVTVALIPSVPGFYARAGCGVAGRRPVFRIDVGDLLRLPAPGRRHTYRDVDPADPADLAAVAALVGARAAAGNGQLDHHGAPGGRQLLALDPAGRVVGWVLLGRRPARRPGGLFTVVVLDLVAADPEAELALWREVVADDAVARDVEALLPLGGRLEQLLPRQVDPVENGTWMLGLLDPAAALSARGYPAGVTAAVTLEVGHAVLRLTVADGTGRVSAGESPDVTLAPDTLAAIYAGATDPVVARHEGRATGDEASARLLRTLFAGPPALLTRPF